MRYFICVMLLCGCAGEQFQVETVTPDAFTVTVQSIETRQDQTLTALAAIKSQVESLNGSILETRQAVGTMEASLVKSEPQQLGGDPAALEPQEPAQANQSQPAIPVASAPAVRLFVSDAPFYCPPCERLKSAIESGEFAEFDVEFIEPFTGQRAYPAIRFRDLTSATGWRVVYGYDQTTLQTIRRVAKEVSTSQPVGSFPAYTSQSAVLGERITFRPDNRQGRRSGRAGNQAFSWSYSAAIGAR
jgi:hypothetical protein